MRHGCCVNSSGRHGHSPLHVVAEIGSMPCAQTLVDPASRCEQAYRDSANPKNNLLNVKQMDEQKQTALHLAAWYGRVDLCQLLIQNAAEVDALDQDQSTPLNLAVSQDHEMTVKCLLRFQADPMRHNTRQLAPIQQACICGAFSW